MTLETATPDQAASIHRSCSLCEHHAKRVAQSDAFIESVCTLSDRERQVMVGICAGQAPARIAKRLHISVKTVSTYRCRILEKLKMKSNVEIAVACAHAGILD